MARLSETPDEAVVSLAAVSKSFGERQVLHMLDLTVARGEFVAITGKSGSGKSTLLNIIGLLDRADRGTVELFGKPSPKIGSRAARELLRDKIGYLFQNAALIDQDTVEDNLKLAQRYAETPSSGSGRALRRREALQAVGLDGFERQKVYELSGGEQLRLAVACLLLKPGDLVLADEPTGSLDAENRDEVIRLLLSLRELGKTVIVVTHDPVVAASADRTVSLD
jgi:putative ABC transport system ATP-binding protein